MKGYLTKFATKAEYSTYVATAYDKPNVSLIAATGEVIFTDYEEPYPGEPIVFADNAVKAICVANWGSDGEITYGQAAAVTTFQVSDIPSAFMENTTITSFDELQYFTSQGASTYRAFYGCTNLESVTLPASVYQVGPQAFSGCTSLETVTIPEGLTTIYSNAFEGCTSLETVTIPEGLTTIGNNAFEGCTSLTDVTIPSTVISMGGAFQGCTSLETVTVKATTPPGLVQADPFFGCTALTAIYVPAESVTAYQTDEYWSNYAGLIQSIPSA